MTVNASPAKVTFYGRTLVNLLGTYGGYANDSNGDGVADGVARGSVNNGKFSIVGGAIHGSKMQRIDSLASDVGYTTRNIQFTVPVYAGKYYLVMTYAVTDGTSRAEIGFGGGGNVGRNTTGYIYKKYASASDLTLILYHNNFNAAYVVGWVAFDGSRVYEIDLATFNKIDVDPEYTGDKLAEKFPYVESAKHTQGVAVRKTSKNLLPPFSQWTQTTNPASQLQIIDSYTATATSAGISTTIISYTMPTSPNIQYTLSGFLSPISTPASYSVVLDCLAYTGDNGTGTIILDTSGVGTGVRGSQAFTTPANSKSLVIRISISSNVPAGTTFTFSNIQLEYGGVATAFEPYNDDYIYLPVTLASNIDGITRDMAYEREGRWYKLKRWVTGYVIDGSTSLINHAAPLYAGSKRVYFNNPGISWVPSTTENRSRLTRYDGYVVPNIDPGAGPDTQVISGASSLNSHVYMSVSNSQTGFGDSIIPTNQEWKNYFNGWRMNNGILGALYEPKTTANFVGKVSGSTTENPHKALGYGGSSLINPSSQTDGFSQTSVDLFKTLDGQSAAVSGMSVNQICQQLFSFNLIEHILRKYGSAMFGSATATVDRVTWLKTNLSKVTANWYGYGSGPNGNNSSFTVWNGSAWGTAVTNSSGSVFKVVHQISGGGINNIIDTSGFVHYLAYADASNGTIASSVYTDFIELEVELSLIKYWTAVDSPRANFIGKIAGSTVENPHTFKGIGANSVAPQTHGSWVEKTQADYDKITALDDTTASNGNGTVGFFIQHMFSFNLIEHVLRKYGSAIFGSATTVADRVIWLKANLARVNCNWYGYGTSATGNKAYLAIWNASGAGYDTATSHTNGTVTKLTRALASTSMNRIDNNGFVHFVTYADPSDGVTNSVLYCDFVDVEIELNMTSVPTTGYATKDYKPYVLDYTLSLPYEEVISEGEGVINLQAGSNQIELLEGIIVREKVTPILKGGAQYYVINSSYTGETISQLKYRADKILAVYKNRDLDNKWVSVVSTTKYGNDRVEIKVEDYDANANYYVTYKMLDKYLYTNNAIEAKIEYQSSTRSVVNELVQQENDNRSANSGVIKSVSELYKRIKALGG